MNEIYRLAFGALVLDMDLQTLPDDTLTPELLMRTVTSNWVQRLWTYQEGLLSKNLFIRGRGWSFILGHVASHHKVLMDSSQELQHSIDPKVCYRMLDVVLNDRLRNRNVDGPLAEQPGLGAQRLLTVINDRSSSRAGDEAICIATTLSIYPSALLPLPAEERMIRLLQLMPSIPMNIMFDDCLRFRHPRFQLGRWMIYHDSASGTTIEEAHLTA